MTAQPSLPVFAQTEALLRAAAPRVELRPYQEDLIARLREAFRGEARRVLAVLATGGGKTIVFCRLLCDAVRKGKRVLVVAHRRELIAQTYDKCVLSGVPAELLGVVMAGDRRWNPGAPVQIASVDTLRRRKLLHAPDLIVLDEAHRSLAEGYTRLTQLYPQAYVTGWTATPWRLDGRGLGELYQALVPGPSVRELQALGFLVRVRVFSHPTRPDLGAVKVTAGGDYDISALARAVDTAVLVGNVVEHWLKLAAGARTIAFAASVEHSRHIAAAFLAAGVPAEHLDGETPADVRAAILERLRKGETLVVSNCAVLCEGFDAPAVKCVILARPTKSKALYFQCIGRGMRPVPGVPEVQSALVLDHAGCAHEHGLPADPQDYSLDGRGRGGDKAPSVTSCPTCFAVLPSGTAVCPECGALLPGRESAVLKERSGELAEMADDEARRQRLLDVRVKKLRGRVQGLAQGEDERRGWEPGTTNKLLYNRFGKSRRFMGEDELKAVAVYLTRDFQVHYPAPPLATTEPEPAPAPPPAPTEVVEWEL